MTQYAVAVDPYAGAFARPPPPGFFGVGSCARAANRPARRPPPPGFFGIGSCFRPAADVPARRPPPPGFFGACRPRVLPPAPCEVPMPPKFSKPTAPAPAPVSCVAAASTKLQRLCPDYEDDIDHNLRCSTWSAIWYAEGKDKTKILPLATRLVDQSLLNYTCLRFLPSVVAASAIFLARRTLNTPDVLAWNTELTELTGYNCSDMTACVLNMFFFSRSLICSPPS
ncbi:hypothetical protein VPH35_111129 [Triticum aestivum]